MLSSKVTAIVLKRINFGEADRMVTVFSREKGKLVLIAKGVRRIKSRRAPHLEPLSETSLVIRKDFVTDARNVRTREFDLKSLSFALYAAEVIDKLLPENAPHEEVYLLFKNFLNSTPNETRAKQFTLELVWQLGFLPRGQAPKEGLTVFVEFLAEKRIRSKKIIDEL